VVLRPGPTPRFPVVVGLDLHGTLLDKQERIPPRLVAPLARALRAARPWARLYVCTGNDMGFVRAALPPTVRRALHGYVLETGASAWERGRERALTPRATQAEAQHIQAALEERGLPGLKHFARRLTTVSAFTRDPYRRHRPAKLVPLVEEVVASLGLGGSFDVKYSSVAVDVVPRGWDKDVGLRKVARGRPTVAIADSQNDWEFLARSDYAFVPRNVAPGVVRILRREGRPVVPLAKAAPGWHPALALRAPRAETAGVLDAFAFLAQAAQAAQAALPGVPAARAR
jgi:hydroxymethylpyrimidine pyrophosphatase-like HAD family hydrolase